MQTHDGLLKRSVLPTLLGLTLIGSDAAAPAFAQSERDHKTHHSATMDEDDQPMFDPAPVSYPQAAPGSLNLYHWKDYTQTKMENGSVNDKRREQERKQDKKRHERMAAYHRTFETDTTSDTASADNTISSPDSGTVSPDKSDYNTWKEQYQSSDTTVSPSKTGMDSYQSSDTGVSTRKMRKHAYQSSDYDQNGNNTVSADKTWKDEDQSSTSTASSNKDWEESPWNQSTDRTILVPGQTNQMTGEGYVYVLRGDTVYQLRADDLSLSAQNTLPWMQDRADYDLPRTSETEDMDIYKSSDIPTDEAAKTGNTDTEQGQTGIRAYPDYPPDMARKREDNSDLNSQPAFHRRMIGSTMPTATLFAAGDYVYIMRGNTLYQLRVSDLSLVNQKDLPAPSTEPENTPDENNSPDTTNP